MSFSNGSAAPKVLFFYFGIKKRDVCMCVCVHSVEDLSSHVCVCFTCVPPCVILHNVEVMKAISAGLIMHKPFSN